MVSVSTCVKYDSQACVEWHLSSWLRYGGLDLACSTDLIKIDVGMMYLNKVGLWCIKVHFVPYP